jgi:DNA-binding transcriptional MerR regulator
VIDEKFLSTYDVARLLGVSYQKVRRYPRSELPYTQYKRNSLRLYDPRDVALFEMRRKAS